MRAGAVLGTPARSAQEGLAPMPRQYIRVPVQERFWSKVDKTEGCWLWLGGRRFGGYGRFCPTTRKSVPAHRYAYETLIGPIPDGLQIDHLCRNRACVNPAHMELVTSRTNTLRGIGPSASNAQKTHCPKGHPYSERNTYRDRRNGRHCRACSWTSLQTRWQRKKLAKMED